MSGIFIEPSETITIKIYAGQGKNGKLLASHDLEMLKKEENFDENSLKDYEVVLRRPSYRDEISILNTGVKGDISAMRFNFAEVNYNRLVQLLKSWTFMDDRGSPIAPMKENVDKLHPVIARAIADALDEIL